MIMSKYAYWTLNSLDIAEHMPTLKRYASECNHITELGVRGIVSTWAFLEGKPERLVSVDNVHPKENNGNLDEVIQYAKENNIDFQFILADDLEIELEHTDLLFIDTLHTYKHLTEELKLHGNKSKKYIIFHDTQSFGIYDIEGGPGLLKAIFEFMRENKNWKIKEQYFNNNGLMILERI